MQPHPPLELATSAKTVAMMVTWQ